MVRKIPRMEKTGGHKRPLKVVVETKRDSKSRKVARAVLLTAIDFAVSLLPPPLSFLAKLVLNIFDSLSE